MMFLAEGGKIIPLINATANTLFESLPVGVFTLDFNAQRNEITLSQMEMYPSEVFYGTESQERADRIIKKYRSCGNRLGALFVGEQGSGKTKIAKHICRLANLPVIRVVPHQNEDINAKYINFIENIAFEHTLLFDEFEKTGDEASQNKWLSVLDGVNPTKALQLFTSNSLMRISTFIRNRPGRIHFMYEYDQLTEDFVRVYCENRGIPQYADNIVELSNSIESFNFNVLSALTSDILLYGESPDEAIKHLNVTPTLRHTYRVEIKNDKGELIGSEMIYDTSHDIFTSSQGHWHINVSPENIIDDQEYVEVYTNASTQRSYIFVPPSATYSAKYCGKEVMVVFTEIFTKKSGVKKTEARLGRLSSKKSV